MRLLVDQCVPVDVATLLVEAGHDASHVATLGMSRATDEEVLDKAAAEARVLISADADFGELLARRRAPLPSVVIYRARTHRRPREQAAAFMTTLLEHEQRLVAGAIVVIEDAGSRVACLPIGRRADPPAQLAIIDSRRRGVQLRRAPSPEIR